MKEKKYCQDRKMDLREVDKKYGRLVVLKSYDSAEIWGFRYELTLGIGTIKIMARTGVFVRVISPTHKRTEGRAPM
jgi:hypothetical protein